MPPRKKTKANPDVEHLNFLACWKWVNGGQGIANIDAKVRQETFENIAFSWRLKSNVAVKSNGSRYEATLQTLQILEWFSKDSNLAVHEKMFGVLPMIGNIFSLDEPEAEHREIGMCIIRNACRILQHVADTSDGLEEITKSRIVKTLCSSATKSAFGSSKAIWLLICFQYAKCKRQNLDLFELGKIINLLVKSIENAAAIDDTNLRSLQTIRVLLMTINPKLQQTHVGQSWVTNMGILIAHLLKNKTTSVLREHIIMLSNELIRNVGVQFALRDGPEFLQRLVHLVCSEIIAGLFKLDNEIPKNKHLIIDCFRFLEEVIRYTRNNESTYNIKMNKSVKSAFLVICGYLKRMQPANHNENMCNRRMESDGVAGDKVDDKHESLNELNMDEPDRLSQNTMPVNANGSKLELGLAKAEETNTSEYRNRINDDQAETTNHPNPQSQLTCTAGEITNGTENLPTMNDAPFVLLSVRALCTWIAGSQESIDEEVIELIPCLVAICNYTFHNLCFYPQHYTSLQHGVFSYLILAFYKMAESNDVHICEILWQPQFHMMLKDYFEGFWVQYKHTNLLFENSTSSQSATNSNPAIYSTSNQKVEDETQMNQELEETTDRVLEVISHLETILSNIGGLILLSQRYEESFDMIIRLHRFAVDNLIAIAENSIFVFLPVNVMTMGLLYLPFNLSLFRELDKSVGILFFKVCVGLIKRVFQVKWSTKSDCCSPANSPSINASWSDMVNHLHTGMIMLSICMPDEPCLCRLIFEADWIPVILQMLEEADVDSVDEKDQIWFNDILLSFAKSDAIFKQSILKYNGIQIASKFEHFDLQTELSHCE